MARDRRRKRRQHEHGMETSINGRVSCACAWSGPDECERGPMSDPAALPPVPTLRCPRCPVSQSRTSMSHHHHRATGHSRKPQPTSTVLLAYRMLEDPISFGTPLAGSVRLDGYSEPHRYPRLARECRTVTSDAPTAVRSACGRALGSTLAPYRSRCTIGIESCRTSCGQFSALVRPEVAARGVPQPQAAPDLNIQAT